MSRPAVFEIAHTDAGFTARFRAAGNRTAVWSTGSQVYERERGAYAAIRAFAAALADRDLDAVFVERHRVTWALNWDATEAPLTRFLEIRHVDERTAVAS